MQTPTAATVNAGVPLRAKHPRPGIAARGVDRVSMFIQACSFVRAGFAYGSNCRIIASTTGASIQRLAVARL